MKVKRLYEVEGEMGHSGTVKVWTFFRSDDFLSKILFFNDSIVEPGVVLEPHEHADIEEVYYLLEGVGRLRIGDEEREVKQGDAVYLPPKKIHTLKNTGTYPLRFICIGAKT